MCTKRLRNQYQEFKFKSISMAFITAIFLSACGIKGDLYQTPEKPIAEQDKEAEKIEVKKDTPINQGVELQEKSVTILNAPKQATAEAKE